MEWLELSVASEWQQIALPVRNMQQHANARCIRGRRPGYAELCPHRSVKRYWMLASSRFQGYQNAARENSRGHKAHESKRKRVNRIIM